MNTWNTDAQFAHDLSDRSLHQNASIKSFLAPRNLERFIVVASKGMGKTLLMRHKREQLQASTEGFLLIPIGQQSDYVNLPSSPSSSILKSLEDATFWEDLWKASIMISMIVNHDHDLSETETYGFLDCIEKCRFPRDVVNILSENIGTGKASTTRPSTILDIFLREGKGQFETFRKFGLNSLFEMYYEFVRSGCAVFIDSLDQELNKRFPGNLEIWCAGQIGLLKASWELTRNNRHAKVFVTIRQEAFAGFKDPEKLNIAGSVLLIKYTKKDLRSIFQLAIHAYDGNYSIAEFFGFEKIYNGFIKIHEDSFEYLERHTIGAPRWLMILGQDLSELRTDRGLIKDAVLKKSHQRQVAEIINSTAGEKLATSYLEGELKLFFGGLEPMNVIKDLLRYVQSTVLSFANLQRLSDRYNAGVDQSLPHPFCLLMNIGLLGHTAPNASSTGLIQKFRRPYEFDWDYDNILPAAGGTYFLLHPCIHFMAQICNEHFKFSKARIGNGLTWSKANERSVVANKATIFVSYATADWDPTVRQVVEELENYFNENGVIADIWIDRRKMRAGSGFLGQMQKGISESRFLILMASANSLRSKPVQAEWQEKFIQGFGESYDNLFPFLIDDTSFQDLPVFLKNIHSYRYEEKPENVHKLAEDIIFWISEGPEGR